MLHPLNDRLKIKLDKNEFNLDDEKVGAETGVVVEVPDILIYLSFHSFAFEDSIANNEKLAKVQDFYGSLKGKRVYWESLQDRGRRFKEGAEEYIYLQMTDVLFYADSLEDEIAIPISDLSSANSFNLQ